MIEKKSIALYIALLCLFVPYAFSFANVSKPIKEGDEFPSIHLPCPESSEARQYLGIEDEDSFTIPQVKAKVVIVYFFSSHSNFCRMQVPYVNELYRIVNETPDLQENIKFIGIGLQSGGTEVDEYKEAYRISFPLIPDSDHAIYKICGKLMTPYFVVFDIREDGSYHVICCVYAFRDVKGFLELIRKKSAIFK